MRRVIALSCLVAAACTATPTPARDVATPTSPVDGDGAAAPGGASRRAVRPFPGGGKIVFGIQRAPGYYVTGVGVVSANGVLVELPGVVRHPGRELAFGYWDPALGERGLLVVRTEEHSEIVAYELAGDRATAVDGWRTDDGLFASFSLDGRWIADVPFDREGHLRTGSVVLVDRRSGDSSRLHLGNGLRVSAWSPDGRMIASSWRDGRSVLIDPRTGRAVPLEGKGGRLAWGSTVTWSPDGDAFAADLGRRRNVVGVFDPYGHPILRVVVGDHGVSLPTWSPDGTRLAYVVRGPEPAGHRHSRLYVMDADTGRTRLVRRDVSDTFWASWSPDGRWLVLDDWTRERWLFVRADGRRSVRYPWLGDMPRWCCPSSPGIEVRDPVS